MVPCTEQVHPSSKEMRSKHSPSHSLLQIRSYMLYIECHLDPDCSYHFLFSLPIQAQYCNIPKHCFFLHCLSLYFFFFKNFHYASYLFYVEILRWKWQYIFLIEIKTLIKNNFHCDKQKIGIKIIQIYLHRMYIQQLELTLLNMFLSLLR